MGLNEPPITLTIRNNSGRNIQYDGKSTNDWIHTGVSENYSYVSGAALQFTLYRHPDMNLGGGYMYFTFSPGGELARPRKFFVCAHFIDDDFLSFVDAGYCDLLHYRPTTAPNLSSTSSDTNTIFPMGKMGVSSLRPVPKSQIPRDITIEIRASDVLPDFLNTGGGHDRWMTEVLEHPATAPHFAQKPISALYLPGSHDAATWAPYLGVSPIQIANAKCQSLTLYEQLKLGIRVFDLRLYADKLDGTPYFAPHHGVLLRTAPNFNKSPSDIGSGTETLLAQLDKFYRETMGSAECIILDLTLSGWEGIPINPKPGTPSQEQRDNFWKLAYFYFANKAIRTPGTSGSLPTLASLKNSAQRFILRMNQKGEREPSPAVGKEVVDFFKDYIWGHGEGAIDGAPYTEALYEQSRSDTKQEAIIKNIEDFMRGQHNTELKNRNILTGQACQVTPSGLQTAPGERRFAPEFNQRLQQALGNDLWLDCVNIMGGDYFDGPTVERIIGMHWRRVGYANPS